MMSIIASVMVILFSSFPFSFVSSELSFPIALHGCNQSCENVSVPYPFGIHDPKCAKNESFFLICNKTGLFFGNHTVSNQIFNISLEVQIFTATYPTAYGCYVWDSTRRDTKFKYGNIDKSERMIYLRSSPFTISPEHNKLFGLGCDTIARMGDSDGRMFGGGCISFCENINLTSSVGSCQTSIPPNVKALDMWVSSSSRHYYVVDSNPCSFGFVADTGFNFSSAINLSALVNKKDVPRTPVALEWAIGERGDCRARESGGGVEYSCSENADCVFRKSESGSICSCKPGFKGNPYLQFGCEDINECELNETACKKDSTCHNKNGSYECICTPGMRGDGKVGCKGLPLKTLITVIFVAVLIGIIAVLILYGYLNILRYRQFIENVNKAMVELGVRKFEEAELRKATNDYARDKHLGEGGFGSVYKGELEDGQLVAIKKSKGWMAKAEQDFINEMKIVSQVNHKNIVKILGLCLETKVRMLVYEFIPNETLYFHITDEGSQILKSWKTRLRIASEIATALNYLHSSTRTPIIHGDIKSTNILLDDQNTAKVADFGASILTSQNQAEMDSTTIQGTLGYLDPEYKKTKKLTEKSDVYSFGVVLIELLTGRTPSTSAKAGEPERDLVEDFISAVEEHQIFQVIDDKLKEDVESTEVEAVAKLAKECVNKSGENRPTMKEVAEELERVKGYSKKTIPAPQETQETGGSAEVVELGKMESYPSVHSSTGSGTSPFPSI